MQRTAIVDQVRLRSFAEAERIAFVQSDGQPCVFVVLAVLQAVGNDFALVCREEDLGDPSRVCAFEYLVDDAGLPTLAPIETEDLYEDVVHLFADLLDD
jgi:hypothetical protein